MIKKKLHLVHKNSPLLIPLSEEEQSLLEWAAEKRGLTPGQLAEQLIVASLEQRKAALRAACQDEKEKQSRRHSG